jgi:conjugative transfer signal peptidase TraF
MMTRSATLITISIAIVAQAFSMWAKPAPRLLWNATASVPIGFYGIESIDQLAVTNLVVALPPNSLAAFLAERGYVPLGVPLIKRVLAIRGQSVCRNELVVSVDGIGMGMARARDRQGRPLPVWEGCRAIAHDEVFLMNWDEPASFDGRYFGPIPFRAIIGRAKPLWTLDKS